MVAMVQSERANWQTWRETGVRHTRVISIRFIRRSPAAIRCLPATRQPSVNPLYLRELLYLCENFYITKEGEKQEGGKRASPWLG